jgi:hypothetical protein
MAESKSQKKETCLAHCGIIFSVTLIPYVAMLGIVNGGLACWLNALSHYLIDWNIWKGFKTYVKQRCEREAEEMVKSCNLDRDKTYDNIVKANIEHYKDTKAWANDHWFYATIGLDQTLHIICYLTTIQLGMKL